MFDAKSCIQFAKYTYTAVVILNRHMLSTKKGLNRRNSSMFFSYIGKGLPVLNRYLAWVNVLAQGHNAVTPERLEPMAPLS